jgi:hypothetical protein
MIQPMNVHPARMFKIRMEVKLGLFRARNAGRKYRKSETSQKKGWKWKKGMNHIEEISIKHAPP